MRLLDVLFLALIPCGYSVTTIVNHYEPVPQGRLIGHIEPILNKLMNIMDNSTTYNRHIAPRIDGKMVVRIGVNIQTINEVDEMKREMHLNLFVRLAWMDYRLKYNSSNESDFIVAGGDIADKIWKPDIYFPNERHGVKHELTVDNVNLRFYSTGQILMVVRYTLILACDMSFELFPFDTQQCTLHFESVKYTQNFMELKWMYAENDIEPVLLKLSKFDLIGSDLTDNCTNPYPIGTFNCLKLTFWFKRQLGYHFAETYFPCIMIVCASWIGFWLEPKSAPARIALGIMSLLTIFGHGNHVKASLPPVSDIKAIDIYIMVCEFFVFATLIEFILSNYMSRKPHRHKNGKKLDRLSRRLFPALFSIFSILYLFYYMYYQQGDNFSVNL